MSWPIIHRNLGSVITLKGGGTPSKDRAEFWGGGIPWATVKDLKKDLLTETQDFITQSGLDGSASRIIESGSIVIATRMAVGRVVIAGIDVAINQDLKGITCSDRVHSKYLYYYLSSQKNYFNRVSSGATVKGIKIAHILDLEIPLPPLAEQQKIAAILDAADQLRQKDQQLIDHYTALCQSLFLEMFGDPVSNPKGWDIQPFNYFAIIDTNMTTDFKKYAKLPHIGIANIEKSTGRLVNYKSVCEDNLSSGKYVFSKDHIIYSKIRPILNKVALPDFEGLASADSYPLLVRSENASKLFFAFLLRSKTFLNFISEHSSRTNIPKVNKSELMKFNAIAPPVALQTEFANHIDLIEKQKKQAQINLQKSESLFNCLLQRAFNGELTSSEAA